MNKPLLLLLVLVVAAGAVFGLVRMSGDEATNEQTVKTAPEPQDLQVPCRHCGHRFALNEAEPIRENPRMVRCPHCETPTPRVAAPAPE